MRSTVASSNARFAALQHRNFVLLWVGLIVSNVGTWMQNVAQGWLVLELTNSPLWLGLLGLSFALPMIFLPLFGGAIVDRVHRIKLIYLTQTAFMLNAFALALLTWLGIVNVWHILITSFVGATLLALDNPARQALIPDLVPPNDLLNALSLNSATYNGAALVGPALAGALLAPLGAGTLFFLNGVSYLAVIIALFALKNVRTHSSSATRHGSIGKSMLTGLQYAWRSRLIFALLGLSTLAAIFGRSYQNLLPIFARDIWHSGPEGYGLLLSAAGGGALVGAFGLASIKQMSRQGTVMVVSGLLFSASIVAFAVSPSLALGIALLFVAGVSTTVFGTIIATFIQIETPNELRGRVMSLYAITLIGVPSLGAMGSGASAEILGGIDGAPRAVLAGAVILGVILAFAAPFFWRRNMSAARK
ncbi:MAG: MFS transporter [Chloroflexota bacterium]|nr:MFS transporter [Chloroflexota bacterium]